MSSKVHLRHDFKRKVLVILEIICYENIYVSGNKLLVISTSSCHTKGCRDVLGILIGNFL